MKKQYLILVITILLFSSLTFIYAHGEEIFVRAEEIIEQKIPCNELVSEQLEILGDYYMEQMHPREQHEIMDNMIGGEGSENLKQMHINMGLSFYCGEHDAMSGEMMNMMMRRTGMMGGFENYRAYGNFGWIFMILILILLILLIFWLIKNIQKK